MSVSPAPMMLQVASGESAPPPRRSTPASVPATGAVESPADSAASTPADSIPAQFSTDMQVDSRHQVYYEFVDGSTGDVVFEIPPEALRAIGESLNLHLAGDAPAHSLDVKS